MALNDIIPTLGGCMPNLDVQICPISLANDYSDKAFQ